MVLSIKESVMVAPSPNGRNSNGRFSPGNSGGPGNPHAKKVGQLRSALIDAVSPADIAAIVGKLVERAKSGDVRAIREVLDRTLGKPVEADLIERLEHLEAIAGELEGQGAR